MKLLLVIALLVTVWSACHCKEPCYKGMPPKRCLLNMDCCTDHCMDNGWCYRRPEDWPAGHPGKPQKPNDDLDENVDKDVENDDDDDIKSFKK